MDYYMELIRELENAPYENIEFSWDMPLRDFIQWVLNIEIGYIFLILAVVICITILTKLAIKDLSKSNSSKEA